MQHVCLPDNNSVLKKHDFEAFGNRLTKNLKLTGKWARRNGITCFRAYDVDMPEFPLAVDWYESVVHVAEYARDHAMEPDEHSAWLEGCMEVLARVFDVHPSKVYLKFRQRQKGLKQYERFNRIGAEFIVHEGGLKFIINPADYLDTGLFLDHRISRSMVREVARDKKVLNLFCYTGSFTVYAAAGGAASTLSIDMSNTYLQWADRNLALNGFEGPEHKLLQADALEWLRGPVQDQFDLIVCDPPTFSNSKRMNGTFDMQRDHAWLLNRVMDRVKPGGQVFFSTNYRRFKPEVETIKAREFVDVSEKTIPEDFRNKKIHKSYWMK